MIRIVKDIEYHKSRSATALTLSPRESWEMIAGYISSGAENITKPSDYHLKFRLTEDNIVTTIDASGPKDEMKYLEDQIAALHAPIIPKISVTVEAFYRLLKAVTSRDHEIRELQHTRDLDRFGYLPRNPVNVLVEEWNEYVSKNNLSEQQKVR